MRCCCVSKSIHWRRCYHGSSTGSRWADSRSSIPWGHLSGFRCWCVFSWSTRGCWTRLRGTYRRERGHLTDWWSFLGLFRDNEAIPIIAIVVPVDVSAMRIPFRTNGKLFALLAAIALWPFFAFRRSFYFLRCSLLLTSMVVLGTQIRSWILPRFLRCICKVVAECHRLFLCHSHRLRCFHKRPKHALKLRTGFGRLLRLTLFTLDPKRKAMKRVHRCGIPGLLSCSLFHNRLKLPNLNDLFLLFLPFLFFLLTLFARAKVVIRP